MVDRRQKTVTGRSDVGEIIFSYMPHAPSPAVAIQTATQVAHMGRSFSVLRKSEVLNNAYTLQASLTAPVGSRSRGAARHLQWRRIFLGGLFELANNFRRLRIHT